MDPVFGPVPSRRLGRSLGINNIPSKWCTYACVYCQVGRTGRMRVNRPEFYSTDFIHTSVNEKLINLKSQNASVDYISFVPDGEPTLDSNLGSHITSLKSFNIPVAVISNASLIFRDDVQNDFLFADLVSLKVDSVNTATWRKINRPHGRLRLPAILKGILDFRQRFEGLLMTETMLIKGINDSAAEAEGIAGFLEKVQPDRAYISIPTRPPAHSGIEPADSESVNRAYQIFAEKLTGVELLTGYEGIDFASSGDLRSDILSISAVHPIREDAVQELVVKSQSNWDVIDALIKKNELIKLNYKDHVFYLRKF